MTQSAMTRGDLLKFLTKQAGRYRLDAIASLERNKRMNHLSRQDFLKLKSNQQLTDKIIDAVLVDFINVIGVSQCIDYGLHTKHL